MMTGGVACNAGVVRELEKSSGTDYLSPQHPTFAALWVPLCWHWKIKPAEMFRPVLFLRICFPYAT